MCRAFAFTFPVRSRILLAVKQALLVLALTASVSGQVVIDDFSDGDFSISSPSVVAGRSTGTMIGGLRQYFLEAIDPSSPFLYRAVC